MPDFPQSLALVNAHSIGTFAPESLGCETTSVGTVTSNTAWPTANLAIFVPVEIYAPITVVKMSILNGSAVSGNADVGIYDIGGNRLVSAGSTAQAGTSAIQTFDITDTLLNPGLYYMALALDNNTGAVGGFTTVAGDGGAMGCYQQASAFALPNPATFAAFAQALIPMITMHQRTTV